MEQVWPIVGIVFGASGFATVALQEILKYRSGRAEQERVENLSLLQRAAYADSLAEWEATRCRIALEHASACRRIALNFGAKLTDLDPWPTMPEKPPKPTPNKDTI